MKKAFTLAEVLITLTIIGVIAALTIPNLMKNWEDQHTVSAVKEAYAILDNAMKIMMRTEQYDDLMELAWENNGWISFSEHPLVDLKPYLKISKYCNSTFSTTCFDYTKVKTLNGWQGSGVSISSGKAQAILANGMSVSIDAGSHNPYVDRTNNRVGGYIRVDINGKKGPNRYGYDIFFLPFTQNGMSVKVGFNNGDYSNSPNNCKTKGSYPTSSDDGKDCAYWILKHNNVDYKYRDVSAEW